MTFPNLFHVILQQRSGYIFQDAKVHFCGGMGCGGGRVRGELIVSLFKWVDQVTC